MISFERTTIMNEAINSRRSIRRYQPDKPVTREQLKQLMTAAMLAPSAKNSRPWEFIAVTKRELLDEIANIHPYAQMCRTATAAIVVVAVPQGKELEGYFSQDCGAATQNILLEAVDMGLGACWCGVFPRKERIPEIAKLFDIVEPKIPFAVIAVGVADETPKQRGFYDETKVSFVE